MALKKLILGTLNLNNGNPNSGFVTQDTNVWDMAEKDLNQQANMQEAGSKSLFPRFMHRKVNIKGFVRDEDSDAFEAQLNSIKAYGLNHRIDLVVGFWGGDITYRCILKTFKPDRKHLPNFSPYKLTLICESPFAEGSLEGDSDTGDFATDATLNANVNSIQRSFYSHDISQPRPTYYIRPIIAFEVADRLPVDSTPAITHIVIGNNANNRKLTIPVSLAISLQPGISHIRGTDHPYEPSDCFVIDCIDLLTLRGDPDADFGTLTEFNARGPIPRWNPNDNTASLSIDLLPSGAHGDIMTRITFRKEFS